MEVTPGKQQFESVHQMMSQSTLMHEQAGWLGTVVQIIKKGSI